MKEEIERIKKLYSYNNLNEETLDLITNRETDVTKADIFKMGYLIEHVEWGTDPDSLAPFLAFDDGDKRIVLNMNRIDIEEELAAFGTNQIILQCLEKIFIDIDFTEHYRKTKLDDLLC